MKRAAIYARVSTHNGQNPEMQVSEIRDYCERRGWEVVGEFVDTGISGSKERRPALDPLLSLCRKRSVDAVVVYRYDRFARSLRQLVNALEEFRTLGIDFVSLHEGVDTSTPNGRLVFGIFASIAEFERELIRDRVRSGLAAAKARGKRLGRPRKDVDATAIARLRAEGASWATIGKTLAIGEGTARRTARSSTKDPLADSSPSPRAA
jgi:DNA invertase Pin-like site-specific DNA recombinase